MEIHRAPAQHPPRQSVRLIFMDDIRKVIGDVCRELYGVEIEPELTRPDPKFGDFSTNIALQLASQLDKKPREIAEELSACISSPDIATTNIAGPGFINFFLSDAALLRSLHEPTTVSRPLDGKIVVAEYSDPNPFKVLHAGHLYTTLVGNAVANLLEVGGANVKRVNFGGDVGLHVAKAMWAIIREVGAANPEEFLALVTEDKRPEWISGLYVQGNEAYESDEISKQEIIDINQRVYGLHSSEDRSSDFAKIYWTCRQWSYDGFEKLYEKLGVAPFDKYYPESETTDLGLESAAELLQKGILEKSEGAIVYHGEKDGLHTRVFINSNGLPTYETKDLGLVLAKWRDYHFDQSIMITANDIQEYMKVVLKVVSTTTPEIASRSTHITHGLIKLAGGQKMSSRKGNILLANDVLDAAAKASADSGNRVDPEVTIGAVKYAFLKNRIGGDIVYDPAESVSIEGNSGPYLQYAHARARSIISKSSSTPTQPDSLEAWERILVKKIGEYPEVVAKAVTDLMPHHICTYLYELCQEFNRFYENSRVIGDPRESFRLSMLVSYADVLKNGLEILGITAPDKM